MKYLGQPGLAVHAGYDAAMSKMAPSPLRDLLASARGEFAAEATRYTTAALAGGLWSEPEFELTAITTTEMSTHYDQRFARYGSPGRPVYDELMVRAGGTCPYCSTRTPTEMDHYLPKSRHVASTLHLDNLVPTCRDCNSEKKAFEADVRGRELLHPYFDLEHQDTWLTASLVTEPGIVVTYEPVPPQTWAPDDAARVSEHFSRLKLGLHYSQLAAGEVQSLRGTLIGLRSSTDGAAAVRWYLNNRHESCQSTEINSWRTALYRALADSDDFCAIAY